MDILLDGLLGGIGDVVRLDGLLGGVGDVLRGTLPKVIIIFFSWPEYGTFLCHIFVLPIFRGTDDLVRKILY